MRRLLLPTIIAPQGILRLFSVIIATSPLFFSCQKQIDSTKDSADAPFEKTLSLQVSESGVVMLQGNETHTAVSMTWDVRGRDMVGNGEFTVQAAIRGTNFEDPISLYSGTVPAVSFVVKDFNAQLRKIVQPGVATMVDFRIMASYPGNNRVYSNAMAMEVTTYQPFNSIDESQVIRVPGNYQSWKVPVAPKLVVQAPGEYEGYIDFSTTAPQFLMVKSASNWDVNRTYMSIGNSKIGFNGDLFSLPAGSGLYQLKVNTNTNVWSYTKINKWGINGSAVTGNTSDATMSKDADAQRWHVTAKLQKGTFNIRANGSDAVSFGHNNNSAVGVPDYNGQAIQVNVAGTYTVVLDLEDAGNYSYSLQRVN